MAHHYSDTDEALQDARESSGDDSDDDDHECTFGPFEHTRLTGNTVRRCTHPGCSQVSMDGDDE